MRVVMAAVASIATAGCLVACERDLSLPYARKCSGGASTPISVNSATNALKRLDVLANPLSCSTSESSVTMTFSAARDDPVCNLYPEPRKGHGFHTKDFENGVIFIHENLECAIEGRPPYADRQKRALLGLMRRL